LLKKRKLKLAKLPVFIKGAEFYCNLFKFDASEIFAQLEEDIKRIGFEKDKILKLKEEKVKQLLECFASIQNEEVFSPALVGRSREESFKTLRELPLFGHA
jgi:hypothetical protein